MLGLHIRGRLKQLLKQTPDRIRLVDDLLCEWLFNVKTLGRFAYQNDVFSDDWELGHYEHAPYYVLRGIFKRLALSGEDVFADYGCGKGRVTSFASRLRLKKVLGIEITPDLARIASENAKNVRDQKSPVEIIVTDASLFDCHEVTAFYFFNPFGKKTMAAVLDRILAGLRKNPRRIQIAYYNPVCGDILDRCEWLKKDEGKTYRTWTTREATKPYIDFYRNTEHTG